MEEQMTAIFFLNYKSKRLPQGSKATRTHLFPFTPSKG
jgi:hypothetical protein